MIITENLLAIEDCLEMLARMIGESEAAKKYRLAKEKCAANVEVAKLEKELQSAYDEFMLIQAYGVHAPDYKEKSAAFYQAKKAHDVCASVAKLRKASMDLQTILDEIAVSIASVVSKSIVVETGNPFFQHDHRKKACSSGCVRSE